jgi:uncharacterized protein (UPF0333 family)
MFSLIITIISIALVAALAIATLYYGGSQFSQGSAKAAADQVIGQAQQIAGANTLYANDHGGSYDLTVSDLQANSYLNSTPGIGISMSTSSNSQYSLGTDSTVNRVNAKFDQVTASAVCLAIEKAAGTATANQTAVNTAQSATAQYDCWSLGGAGFSFQFKG